MTYQVTIEASNIKELFKELGSMQADIIGFKEIPSTVEPIVAGDFAFTVPITKAETAQTSTAEAITTATDTKDTEKEESKSSDEDELFG